MSVYYVRVWRGIWMLQIKPRSFARASALNNLANSPAPLVNVFTGQQGPGRVKHSEQQGAMAVAFTLLLVVFLERMSLAR